MDHKRVLILGFEGDVWLKYSEFLIKNYYKEDQIGIEGKILTGLNFEQTSHSMDRIFTSGLSEASSLCKLLQSELDTPS